jgi:hypothetical protein
MTASPDFGHLGPMLAAARRELANAGVTKPPDVVIADAGYEDRLSQELDTPTRRSPASPWPRASPGRQAPSPCRPCSSAGRGGLARRDNTER